MLVSSYLKENQISLDIKAANKDEAIKELSLLLKDCKDITNFDDFIQDVSSREALSTTGIGNEIGIPHARTEAVKDFVIAFGRSEGGIEFASLDGRPAKLIFLMGTPKEKNLTQYLQFLAKLTRLLKNESFRKTLLKARSPEEILAEFKKAEK